MEHVPARTVLVVADTGIYQNSVVRSTQDIGLYGQHNFERFGLDVAWHKPITIGFDNVHLRVGKKRL